MDGNDVLDQGVVRSLLNPPEKSIFQSEECQHSWANCRHLTFEKPLLRAWDDMSGSQPDLVDNCMRSRAPRARLDTYNLRQDSLRVHVDHKRRESTPYISFTDSPDAIRDLINMRSKNRGKQTVTAINPKVRLAAGLPILDIATEMKHYGVEDPYNKNNQYYSHHYLCLWEVGKEEIVSHWAWEQLARNGNWYEEIVLPAFESHDQQKNPAAVKARVGGFWSW